LNGANAVYTAKAEVFLILQDRQSPQLFTDAGDQENNGWRDGVMGLIGFAHNLKLLPESLPIV
jgi:hypothetical protein